MILSESVTVVGGWWSSCAQDAAQRLAQTAMQRAQASTQAHAQVQ